MIERFIRSMKGECTSRILVPLDAQAMRRELFFYAFWYNEHRPHQALDGRTPLDVHNHSPTTSPGQDISRDEGLILHVEFLEGRRHLPVVELRRAA